MSAATLLLLLTPFLLPLTIAGMVVIVALHKAKPEDVPTVVQEFTALFRRALDRIPHPRHPHPTPREVHNGDTSNQAEEAP